MTALADDGAVAVLVSRHVALADATAFEAALHDLIEAARRFPGQLSAEVLRGAPAGGARDYHIAFRFAGDAALRHWLESPERRAALARVEPLCRPVGPAGPVAATTGLEPWLDLPAGAPPPPPHRQAMATWLGIYPLASLILWLLSPVLAPLPYLARTAIITAALVLAMTYLVMPPLARLLAPWLRSVALPSKGTPAS